MSKYSKIDQRLKTAEANFEWGPSRIVKRLNEQEARVAALEARHRFPEGVPQGGLSPAFSAVMGQSQAARIHGNKFEDADETPEPRCCPFCGSYKIEIIVTCGRSWVCCRNERCEAAGRKRINAAKAVEAWNRVESHFRTALEA